MGLRACAVESDKTGFKFQFHHSGEFGLDSFAMDYIICAGSPPSFVPGPWKAFRKYYLSELHKPHH